MFPYHKDAAQPRLLQRGFHALGQCCAITGPGGLPIGTLRKESDEPGQILKGSLFNNAWWIHRSSKSAIHPPAMQTQE